MGDTHAYEVTLSPKGQVATARCSCGWEGKHRATGAGPAELLARASGEHHIEIMAAEGSSENVRHGSGRHLYTLMGESYGGVLAKCDCGWLTRFRGEAGGGKQSAEEVASEYAERHVKHALMVDEGVHPDIATVRLKHGEKSLDSGEHKYQVEFMVGACVVWCECGWTERLERLSDSTAADHMREAARVGLAHDEEANRTAPTVVASPAPSDGRGADLALGFAAMVFICFLVVAAFNIVSSDEESDNGDDYAYTETGGGDPGDICRKQKAWWADRPNGEDVIAGMGEC